ncbi:synaptonemal complex central element protein 1-like isoform X3 [Balaenoptera musculus]|uniref:Synaptonemal complex central element protein 1-like isoform X3 n=2 Tax=Balaenoptera musculus TaxID=9771 RepID=A0A8B8VY71_BALMU|nr:synaptonemal complex central element protein 1-like isoform X3 [Balaenoptera musculus]
MTSADVPVRTSGSLQGLFPPPARRSSYIIRIASCYLELPFSSQLKLHPNRSTLTAPSKNRIPPSLTPRLDLFLHSLYFYLTWCTFVFLIISTLSINHRHPTQGNPAVLHPFGSYRECAPRAGEAASGWSPAGDGCTVVNGEKVHLEEVLSKKQEALRTLQLHCQRKGSEAQRKYMLAEHMEHISLHNSPITESQGQRKPGLHVEERLEDLTGQHKDPWEFHMLKQRLAWEIRALQSSKEQLLTEERQARAKLETVERRLCSPPEVQSAPAEKDGLKAELEKLGGQVPAQNQTTPEDRAGEAGPQLPSEGDLAPPAELALTPP